VKDDAAFDVEVLADKALEMLPVSPGQVIWIWANFYSVDLIEALAYRIRALGAFWSMRLNSETLLHRIGLDVPEEYLPLVPEHELRWLDDMDAIIEIRDHGSHVPDVSLERRRAMGAEWRVLIDEATHKGIRRVTVIHPTPALAAAYGMPLEALQHMVMQAVNVDYAAVDRRQAQIANLLGQTQAVRVTSAAGADLQLRVTGRKALVDSNSIPRGEAYIAPLEDSAEGVAVIDKAFIRGKSIPGLRLTFSAGRAVGVDALDASGAESLRELLAASSGDKDRLAEFSIGTNPGVREPTGMIALDEKIGGSVHIAVGMNEHFGGKNRSNLHLDLVILKPNVWFDGKIILEKGEFRE